MKVGKGEDGKEIVVDGGLIIWVIERLGFEGLVNNSEIIGIEKRGILFYLEG